MKKKILMLLIMFIIMMIPVYAEALDYGYYNFIVTVNGEKESGVKIGVYTDSISCSVLDEAITTDSSGKALYKAKTTNDDRVHYYKILSSGYKEAGACNTLDPITTSSELVLEVPIILNRDGNYSGGDSSDTTDEYVEFGFTIPGNQFLSGVKYEMYKNSTCTGSPLASKTSEAGYQKIDISPGTYYYKTTYVPNNYQSKSCTQVNFNSNVPKTSVMLYPITDDEEDNDDTNEESVTTVTTTINAGFMDKETKKYIAGVKFFLSQDNKKVPSGNAAIYTSENKLLSIGPASGVNVGTWYMVVTELPTGYDDLDFFTYQVKASDAGKTIEAIAVLTSNSSSEDDSTGTETPEVEQGTIKINVVDKETGKALSDVGVQVCKTKTCEGNDLMFAVTSSTIERNIAFGTYYIVVTSVPNSYEKPEPIKITLDKENPISTTKLEVLKQTEVPNTLSNASKVFIICGLIGMIAGISLLYFNAKKQEEI